LNNSIGLQTEESLAQLAGSHKCNLKADQTYLSLSFAHTL